MMHTQPTSVTVQHDPQRQTFEAIVEGQRCMADYQRDGDVIHMTHTVVPPSLEGRGIAAQLVEAALRWAQAEGLKVNPVCSYVRVYMQRHPQWMGIRV